MCDMNHFGIDLYLFLSRVRELISMHLLASGITGSLKPPNVSRPPISLNHNKRNKLANFTVLHPPLLRKNSHFPRFPRSPHFPPSLKGLLVLRQATHHQNQHLLRNELRTDLRGRIPRGWIIFRNLLLHQQGKIPGNEECNLYDSPEIIYPWYLKHHLSIQAVM